MRFYEFKTVLNKEQVPAPAPAPIPPKPPAPSPIVKKAIQSIDDIEKIDTANVPEPALEKVNAFITKLVAKIQQKISQSTGEQIQTENTAGAVQLNTNLEMLGQVVIDLCNTPGEAEKCDGYLKQLGIEKLDQIYDFLTTAQTGIQDTTTKNIQTLKKEMKGKLKQLVKKAEGLDAETTLDKSSMSAVQSSILNQLSSIIDTIEDRAIPPATINKFLDHAIAGEIIDMKSLVARKQGQIDDHINPKLDQDVKDLFDEEIKNAFFGFIPGGTTAGNYGPAEVGLAILGNPAKKADSRGDLIVGDVAFELKGSGYKPSKSGKTTTGGLYGARLNSKGIGPGTAAWETLNKEIKKINPKMKESNPSKEKGAIAQKGYMNAYNITTSKGEVSYKLSSRYNFNKSGLDKLNKEILIPKGNPENTIQLLDATFKAVINGHKKVIKAFGEESWNSRIAAMVDPDGSINQKKMLENFSALAYDSYKIEDKVENILFVNSHNRNYYLIGTQDELIKAIQTGDIEIKSGITWNDDQQKATPQYARS